MKTLIPILLFGMFFAYLTEKSTVGKYKYDKQTRQNKLFFAALILLLALPIGLRRMYNDTGAYINGFNASLTVLELFSSGELFILSNPAFKLYTALIHDLTGNYHIYFMIPAVFTQYMFMSTIRRYSKSFTLGVGLYICLGTYVFSIAAMKQVIAMSILMMAIPKLLDKKYVQFYLIVFVAFLFHTYAIAFAVLPLFTVKPWKFRTFALLAVVVIAMYNFESVIGSFLDFANEQGKSVAEYEVFDDAQVNVFRVAVYAVVPALSLLMRPYIFGDDYDRCYDLLIHMSIISLAFMLMGLVEGANMFARMATYFEMGMICSLSWMIDRVFTERSKHIVNVFASICFFLYFVYAYQFALVFDDHYRAVTIFEFIKSLLVV
ncbi:MAG: EpsG family protein [Oscillospiraceae bacterium]|nr:EpsG family protein [Oscillospiraceae bacterium]